MTTLENRYRRLLALFPRDHRLLYEEEMIGVLMADAEPGRRRPALRERADLVRSAVVVRMRRACGAIFADAWRQAAYAVLLFGAIGLFAVGVRRIALEFAASAVWPGPHSAVGIGVAAVLRPALWGLVIAAALIGWRRAAAVLALAAVVAETARAAAWYAFSPTQMLHTCWLLTFAVVVAAAAGWLVRGAGLPRPRGLRLLVGASATLVAGGVVDVVYSPWRSGTFGISIYLGPYQVGAGGLGYLITLGLVVWAWRRQPWPVRARMLAFGAPIAAILVLIPAAFSGFITSSQRFETPIPLAPVQWVLLVAVPLLAFALAAATLQRWERLSHLVRLGREAEEQFRDGPLR